jgi:hypothetical protein
MATEPERCSAMEAHPLGVIKDGKIDVELLKKFRNLSIHTRDQNGISSFRDDYDDWYEEDDFVYDDFLDAFLNLCSDQGRVPQRKFAWLYDKWTPKYIVVKLTSCGGFTYNGTVINITSDCRYKIEMATGEVSLVDNLG